MASPDSGPADGTIAAVAPRHEEIDRLGRALEETRAVLAEQSHRLRLAVDAARIIAWEIDLQTGEVRYEADPEVMRSNQFFPEFLPHTIDTWLAMVHPDDRARANASFRRTLKEL